MGGSGSNQNPEEDPPSSLQSRSEEHEQNPHILIVEDSASDVFLIRTAIKTANIKAELHVVRDGEQAVRFFEAADNDNTFPCPSVVLLDINLPRRKGSDVLQQIRSSRRCRRARVIVVSTSNSQADRENMAQLGADGYFHKPSEYAAFMKLGDVIKSLLSPAA